MTSTWSATPIWNKNCTLMWKYSCSCSIYTWQWHSCWGCTSGNLYPSWLFMVIFCWDWLEGTTQDQQSAFVVSKGKGKIACIDLWPWIIADQTCPNQLNSLIHLPILTTYHVLNYSTIDANLVRKAPILLAKILTPILDKILNNA